MYHSHARVPPISHTNFQPHPSGQFRVHSAQTNKQIYKQINIVSALYSRCPQRIPISESIILNISGSLKCRNFWNQIDSLPFQVSIWIFLSVQINFHRSRPNSFRVFRDYNFPAKYVAKMSKFVESKISFFRALPDILEKA